jgi:hypothetical protein
MLLNYGYCRAMRRRLLSGAELDTSGYRFQISPYQSYECRLPRAVGSDQAGEQGLLQFERRPVDDARCAVVREPHVYQTDREAT